MGYDFKSLVDGQLPDAKGTLYTVPGATTCVIKLITLVNTNTTTEVVNLYVKPSGSSSRRIIPQNLNLSPDYSLIFDDGVFLEAGDILEGDTTTASKVDYIISGVEQS